jgi:excisionase family DNA binding protein
MRKDEAIPRPFAEIVDRFRRSAEAKSRFQLDPDHVAALLSGGFLEWLGRREAAELLARDVEAAPKRSTFRAYSAAALAERWGVSTSAIYTLIKSGELTAFKLGDKLYRISNEAVERYEAGRS